MVRCRLIRRRASDRTVVAQDGETSAMTGLHLPDLGDLLLIIALFFSGMIVVSGCAERRREDRRERQVLEAIEREYELFFHAGRL